MSTYTCVWYDVSVMSGLSRIILSRVETNVSSWQRNSLKSEMNTPSRLVSDITISLLKHMNEALLLLWFLGYKNTSHAVLSDMWWHLCWGVKNSWALAFNLHWGASSIVGWCFVLCNSHHHWQTHALLCVREWDGIRVYRDRTREQQRKCENKRMSPKKVFL